MTNTVQPGVIVFMKTHLWLPLILWSDGVTRLTVAVVIALLASMLVGHSQGSAFAYQGRLIDGGQPASGSYDLQLALTDAATNGNYVGAALTRAPVLVSNGLFAVTLDFGTSAFDGSARWLEIGVRTNGSTAPYILLSPRQAILATPYAVFAGSAATLPPGTTVVLNGAGITNLIGQNLQPGTVNSNAFDAETQAQLALAGSGAGSGNSLRYTNPLLLNPKIQSTGPMTKTYTNILGYSPDSGGNWMTTNSLVELVSGIGNLDPSGSYFGSYIKELVDANNNNWEEFYNAYHTKFVVEGLTNYGPEMQVTTIGGYALSTGYGVPGGSTNYRRIHRAWQWGIGGYGQPYIYHQGSLIPHVDNTNLFDSMYPVFYKANVWTNAVACVAAGSLDPYFYLMPAETFGAYDVDGTAALTYWDNLSYETDDTGHYNYASATPRMRILFGPQGGLWLNGGLSLSGNLSGRQATFNDVAAQGRFVGNGSGLTNVTASGLAVQTNGPPADPITVRGWMNVTNGGSVFKVPLYQ